MIYVNNDSWDFNADFNADCSVATSQTIKVPRMAKTSGTSYVLQIKRPLTLPTYTTITTTYISQDDLFVTLGVVLPSLVSGEYEYKMTEGTQIVSGGILRIMSDVVNPTEYNNIDTYIEYEPTI